METWVVQRSANRSKDDVINAYCHAKCVYTSADNARALPSHLSPDYFVVFDRRKLSALSVETSINGSTGSRPLSPRFRETRVAFVS